jgi:putative methylase
VSIKSKLTIIGPQMMAVKKKDLEIALQNVAPIRNPKPNLEQYSTPASIAADVLFSAYARGDICGKSVADLGCGSGIFAVGAALLGASSVIAVDTDAVVLAQARENAKHLNVEIDFVNSDVSDFLERVDTVLMNPPFGSQNRHADRPFLEKAMSIGSVVYSLHLADTSEWLLRLVVSAGNAVVFQKRYKFEIPHMFAFHSMVKKDFQVVLLCIQITR